MKFIALLFLVCLAAFVSAQPEITGTDFVIDNIIKPLLQEIQQNSLTFLQQLLMGMIPGIGKRDIENSGAHIQAILIAFEQHLAESNADISGSFAGLLNGAKSVSRTECIQN